MDYINDFGSCIQQLVESYWKVGTFVILAIWLSGGESTDLKESNQDTYTHYETV